MDYRYLDNNIMWLKPENCSNDAFKEVSGVVVQSRLAYSSLSGRGPQLPWPFLNSKAARAVPKIDATIMKTGQQCVDYDRHFIQSHMLDFAWHQQASASYGSVSHEA